MAAPETAAAATGGTVAPKPIAELIAQLGSEKAQDRDAAQTQLENAGPAALAPLSDAAQNSDDPEVRSRAAAVLAKLKSRQATGPTPITLDVDDGSASAVLAAISAQAGGKLVPFGLAPDAPGRQAHTATLHVKQKPFWEVMTDACTQLHVAPALDATSLHSMRVSPAWEDWLANDPHEIVGAYWIGVAGLARTRSIDLGTGSGPDAADDELTLHLIVYPEPKLAVTQLSFFQVTEALDDAGNSLLPRSLSARMRQPVRQPTQDLRQINHTLEIHLPYPQEHPGTKISVLSGELTATELGEFKQFEMSDVLGKPAIASPLPDGVIKAAVTRVGSEFRVEIDCSREGLSDEQWSALLHHFGDVALEDAHGHPLNVVSPVGIHSMRSIANIGSFIATGSFSAPQIAMIGPNEGQASVNAGANGEKNNDPQNLTWRFPASVNNVTLPVTLKDIPMP